MKRLLYITNEPDNTITSMIRPGDYIFYKTKEGGTYPTIADRVGRKRIYCEVHDGRHTWVSKSNCQLQEEWRKENER